MAEASVWGRGRYHINILHFGALASHSVHLLQTLKYLKRAANTYANLGNVLRLGSDRFIILILDCVINKEERSRFFSTSEIDNFPQTPC